MRSYEAEGTARRQGDVATVLPYASLGADGPSQPLQSPSVAAAGSEK